MLKSFSVAVIAWASVELPDEAALLELDEAALVVLEALPVEPPSSRWAWPY